MYFSTYQLYDIWLLWRETIYKFNNYLTYASKWIEFIDEKKLCETKLNNNKKLWKKVNEFFCENWIWIKRKRRRRKHITESGCDIIQQCRLFEHFQYGIMCGILCLSTPRISSNLYENFTKQAIFKTCQCVLNLHFCVTKMFSLISSPMEYEHKHTKSLNDWRRMQQNMQQQK